FSFQPGGGGARQSAVAPGLETSPSNRCAARQRGGDGIARVARVSVSLLSFASAENAAGRSSQERTRRTGFRHALSRCVGNDESDARAARLHRRGSDPRELARGARGG